MDARRLLFMLTGSLIVIGVGASVFVFEKSLKPNTKANANRPVFSSNAVPIGEMVEFRESLYADSIFVVRSDASTFVVFAAYWQENYEYFSMYNPNIDCAKFKFDDQKIICSDSSGVSRIRWDLDGKSSEGADYDLELIEYEIISGNVYLE